MAFQTDTSTAYLNNLFGVVTGTTTGTQFPSIPGPGLFRLKTDADNVSPSFLGGSAGTCVFQFNAGTDSDWLNLNNLNQLFHSDASGTMCYWYYWVQR